jgi:hypothetical protein
MMAAGRRCTATLIATGGFSLLPAVVIDLAAEAGTLEACAPAGLGLAPFGDSGELPGPAAGWAVFACPGPDRIDVLASAPARTLFFSGACGASAEWRRRSAELGYCLLIAGHAVLADDPARAPDPALVASHARAAGAGGRAVAGLVPVYWPLAETRGRAGSWPGTIRYGARARLSWGFSLSTDVPEDVRVVAASVRAGAPQAGPELVRQQLVTELLLAGRMLPRRIADQLVDDIVLARPGKWRDRTLRGQRVALLTSWLLMRTVAAFLLFRPKPHWHILGQHLVRAFGWPPLDVAVDPWAGELLAVGEEDEFDVRLALAGPDPGRPDSARPQVVVYRGDYRVGVLGAEAAARYRRVVAEHRQPGADVVTLAARSRSHDGSWRLQVSHPAS